MFKEGDTPALIEFGAKVHKAAGKGDEPVVGAIIYAGTLIFTNEKIPSRKIRVVTYAIDVSSKFKEKTHHYRHVTKGTRDDCVFFLEMLQPASACKFKLLNEVCGVEEVLLE